MLCPKTNFLNCQHYLYPTSIMVGELCPSTLITYITHPPASSFYYMQNDCCVNEFRQAAHKSYCYHIVVCMWLCLNASISLISLSQAHTLVWCVISPRLNISSYFFFFFSLNRQKKFDFWWLSGHLSILLLIHVVTFTIYYILFLN